MTGNGSYFGLGSATAYVLGLFAVMTFAFIACNLPIVWTIPTAWRPRAVRGQDTDLWLWLLSAALSVAVGLRFFGHYYLQLLPPLCLLTRRRAAPSGRERIVQGHGRVRAHRRGGFTVVGSSSPGRGATSRSTSG